MNRTLPACTPTLVACCAALGALSGLCCWLVIRHGAPFGAGSAYLPGAILGGFALAAGQALLRRPRISVVRAMALPLLGVASWRLAQLGRELGGPAPWMSASLIGAWGIGLGVLLAWPHQVRPVRILSALSGAGILGGLLFTWAVGQRLSRAGEGPWPLLMICAWQAGLLIALAVSLGPSSRARAVAEEP